MDAWSLMRGDAFIHFVSGSRRVNIRLGVLLLIPKSPQNFKEPLMGGPAIKGLNLLKAVNIVKTEGHQCRKEFSELLTSIVKLEHRKGDIQLKVKQKLNYCGTIMSINVCMYMCGSLCVLVDGWSKSGSYLRHLWNGTGVSRRPFFVYFGAKTTESAVPMKICKTGRKTKDVS